jgi:uncharacterized RDD family membrane protein YckC
MDEHNPYRSPAAQVAETLPQERLKIEPASRWRRFFNLLIDYGCFTLVAILLVLPYSMWLMMEGGEAAVATLEEANFLRDYAIGIGAMLLYYIPMEGLFGFTVGKLITGTRVVTEDGGKPRWGQIIGRTFARFIPFEAFSVLFANDKERRGWHDSLPKTYVVRKR